MDIIKDTSDGIDNIEDIIKDGLDKAEDLFDF